MKEINKPESPYYFVRYDGIGFPNLGRKADKYEYKFNKKDSLTRTVPIELEVGDLIKICNREGKRTHRELIDQHIGSVYPIIEVNPSNRYGIVVELEGTNVYLSTDNVDIYKEADLTTGDMIKIQGDLYLITDVFSDISFKGGHYGIYGMRGITGTLNMWWVGDVKKVDKELYAFPFKVPELSEKFITTYSSNSIDLKSVNGLLLYVANQNSHRPPTRINLYVLDEEDQNKLLQEYSDFEFVKIEAGIEFLNPKEKIINQLPKKKGQTLRDSLQNIGRNARRVRTRRTNHGGIIVEEF